MQQQQHQHQQQQQHADEFAARVRASVFACAPDAAPDLVEWFALPFDQRVRLCARSAFLGRTLDTATTSTANLCVMSGNLRCLRYWLSVSRVVDMDDYLQCLCRLAAEYGQLDCLKLLAHGYGGYLRGCEEVAATHGHLDCMIFACEHKRTSFDLRSLSTVAAQYGHLACLQYAATSPRGRGRWDDYACTVAARHGHLDCLQYLHERGCPWSEDAVGDAAACGHLSCLQYAHEHGCPVPGSVSETAVRCGHLACLVYAHERCGSRLPVRSCDYAAESGNVDCLAYVRRHGCAWTAMTCVLAAQYGNVACLAYARKHGCKWSRKMCSLAVRRGWVEWAADEFRACLRFIEGDAHAHAAAHAHIAHIAHLDAAAHHDAAAACEICSADRVPIGAQIAQICAMNLARG